MGHREFPLFSRTYPNRPAGAIALRLTRAGIFNSTPNDPRSRHRNDTQIGSRWEKPLMIDVNATATAATINRKSNVDRKRIAKKLRIFLIIVRVYCGHLNQF
jgi:hypothetical protein